MTQKQSKKRKIQKSKTSKSVGEVSLVLKKGDIVDIVAPGFSTSQSHLEAAIEFVKKIGLVPRVPNPIFGDDVVCSHRDEVRLQHLQKALAAKDSKVIWCIRGGYGAIRLIEKFAATKKPLKPKLFIGYSDACTIHNFLNQFWKWPSLHGPLLDRLGQQTLPTTQVDELVDLLFGRREEFLFPHLIGLNAAARLNKTISGRVVGGNLTVTHSLLGTRFMRPPQGQILFFEDTGERGYRVDRMLKQLQMAGYFKKTLAVLFGEFVGGHEPSGENKVPHVLKRFAEEMKIPVLAGMPVGHGDQQRPLPLFTRAELQLGLKAQLKVRSPFE